MDARFAGAQVCCVPASVRSASLLKRGKQQACAPTNRALAILGVIFAVLVAVCVSSPASRIGEKAEVFRALSPADQSTIRRGEIEEGFNGDMVYMALGRPTVVEKSPGGEKWTYRNFYPSTHVSDESLFQKSDSSGNANASLAGSVGKSGTLTDSGAHGGYVGNSGAMIDAPEVPPALMEVWFSEGRVTAYKLTP
ncbi:MAG: hypothetical protein JWM35_857 [Verrucomicrobia bacterium]|nr:hypothetical protein [Verrucomicrobiota bacterium]